jgi:glycosyltransferase involved in cell wall biosynthesis
MRCLWLTREFPKPTVRGDLLYARNLIENLAGAGAAVTALALSQTPDDVPAGQDVCTRAEDGVEWRVIRRQPVNRVWSLLSRLPGDAYRNGTKEYRRELDRQLDAEPWDAVIINHVGMGWAFAPVLQWQRTNGRRVPIVYVSHNHEMSLKMEVAASHRGSAAFKAVLKHDARKFVRLERFMIENSALMTTITEADRDLYRRDFREKPILCLLPGYDGAIVPERTITAAVPRTCIIFGSINWIAKKQNMMDFLRCAEPIFTKAGIRVDIVGNVDADFARDAAAVASCCRFVGRVDDVSPYFAEARVGIMADRVGGGFKHKNLQYIFHRVPLVTMTGQAHGLALDEGDDLIVAETLEDLALKVVALIDDFERLNALQNRAFAKCQGHFEWPVRGAQLFQALRSAADPTRAATALNAERRARAGLNAAA